MRSRSENMGLSRLETQKSTRLINRLPYWFIHLLFRTLEERERAYAEARRRILGDNSDEGDQSGKFGDQSQTKRFQDGAFEKGRGNGERGRRGGRGRNNGRPRNGNRENNYERKEEEKSRTNTRTNPPRGYKNRSNGESSNIPVLENLIS